MKYLRARGGMMRRTWWLGLLGMAACNTTLTSPRDVATVTRELKTPQTGVLDIRVGAGELKVVGAPLSENVVATGVLRTLLPDAPNKDANALEDLRFDLVNDDGQVELVVAQSDAFLAWYVDVTVEVPEGVFVQIRDGAGDISVTSVDGASIEDAGGKISVNTLFGDLTIDDEAGDISLLDIEGRVEINDGSGRIEGSSFQSDIEIWDASGDISIDSVFAHLQIDDEAGDIYLSRVDSATVHDGSGDIHLTDVASWELLSDDGGEVFGD